MAHAMPQVPGVDHEFVRDGDDRFHLAVAGGGDPVVLLHGWPQHWYAWRAVIPPLAERNRVIAMDLRGFGWSDIAWEGFERERMADDVARVLGLLELDRVRVVGHDWGGWIGFLLALRRPELVERLVVLSAPPPWASFGLPRPASLRRLGHDLVMASPAGWRLLRNTDFAGRRVAGLSVRRDNLGPEELAIYARDLQASTRARAGVLFHRAFLARELPAIIRGRYRNARPTVPTLGLYGERDPILPAAFVAGHERDARRMRVEAVPGAGHYLPEEAPEVVAARVLDFLETSRPNDPGPGASGSGSH
jgi:pimeloyl-ACP methyl ester carboxylesterase